MIKMKNIKYWVLTLCTCFMTALVNAQPMNTTKEEPTDFMHGSGKIYVVMAVVVVIISGLLIYVANVDRKITKLEKEINNA